MSYFGVVQSCTSATLWYIAINFSTIWQDGWSSLMIASQSGHVQVVAELLQRGAKVDMQKKVWLFCFSCFEFVACVGLVVLNLSSN